jgi:hypothetical protein
MRLPDPRVAEAAALEAEFAATAYGATHENTWCALATFAGIHDRHGRAKLAQAAARGAMQTADWPFHSLVSSLAMAVSHLMNWRTEQQRGAFPVAASVANTAAMRLRAGFAKALAVLDRGGPDQAHHAGAGLAARALCHPPRDSPISKRRLRSSLQGRPLGATKLPRMAIASKTAIRAADPGRFDATIVRWGARSRRRRELSAKPQLTRRRRGWRPSSRQARSAATRVQTPATRVAYGLPCSGCFVKRHPMCRKRRPKEPRNGAAAFGASRSGLGQAAIHRRSPPKTPRMTPCNESCTSFAG